MSYYVGVDAGQTNDYTAVAVVRRVPFKNQEGKKDVKLYLEHLERIWGKPYSEVADDIKVLMEDERLGTQFYDHYNLRMHQISPKLVLDAHGVGHPVVKLFKQRGLSPRVVAVHGGQQDHLYNGFRYLPKRDLITALQVNLQTGSLEIAEGLAFYDAFIEEAQNYRVRQTPSGLDVFGAWREEEHDDLIFAVCIACWYAAQEPFRMWAIDPWGNEPPRLVFGPPVEV